MFQMIKKFLIAHPKLRGLTKPLWTTYFRTLMKCAAALKGIDPDKVVFSSFRSTTYSDNPRVISEKLHEMYPQAEIVWLFREPEKKRAVVPDYVRIVNATSMQAYFELATARVWVDNFAKRSYLPLNREKQVYLNTWHGDRAFKKIGYDVVEKRYYRLEQDCHAMIAGSTFGEKMMRSAFGFKGDIIFEGSPRDDRLVNFDPAAAAEIRRKLGVSEDVGLLLYAPTFRDTIADTAAQSATMDLKRTIQALEKKTGKKWLCLFRAHYLQMKGLNLDEVKDLLLDMTKYEDMTELLMIADALLTDYSSCAMDFCLLGRPIYLFQSDIEEYTTKDREMYFEMKDTPFFSVQDQDALEALIDRVGEEEARENCRQICEYFGFRETGRATEAVCEYLIERLKKKA